MICDAVFQKIYLFITCDIMKHVFNSHVCIGINVGVLHIDNMLLVKKP